MTYNTAGALSLATSAYYLKGSFNGWGTTDAFSKTDNADVITITKALPAGSYEFKVHNAGTDSWYGKDDTTISDETNRLTVTRTGGNMTLAATGGVYEFKYEISTNKLSIYSAENNAMDQMPTGEDSCYIIGDADDSGDLTILDATAIQRVLADYAVKSFNEKAACVTGEDLSILDATMIQRYLADYATPYHIGDYAK
ncbi:MAG: hypothetical protein IJR57_09495 [Ruminococcus sp.]|nr:hypothetical protein [Ruminococcus sp.]